MGSKNSLRWLHRRRRPRRRRLLLSLRGKRGILPTNDATLVDARGPSLRIRQLIPPNRQAALDWRDDAIVSGDHLVGVLVRPRLLDLGGMELAKDRINVCLSDPVRRVLE